MFEIQMLTVLIIAELYWISVKCYFLSQVTFSEGQRVAIISVAVLADGVPELREYVTISLLDVTTVGLKDLRHAAVIDQQLAKALLTILPNGSPYGVIGWHLDSQFTLTQEPQSEDFYENKWMNGLLNEAHAVNASLYWLTMKEV